MKSCYIMCIVFSLFLLLQQQTFADELPACQCVDGNKQIECDEAKSSLGANRCQTPCECTIGRHCVVTREHMMRGEPGWCEKMWSPSGG